MTPAGAPPPEGRWALWDADIELDQELYEAIVQDVRANGGAHAPHTPWHDETLFPGDGERQRAPAWTDMLRPWVSQAYLATAEDIAACRAFIDEHAPGGSLPPGASELLSGDVEVGVVDLRTILDVALITAHAERPGGRMLEVGGGYGRIAEAMLRLEERPAGYLLIDAVPATLYYAYAYLRQALPERSIGFHYVDQGASPADFDCFIAPRWHVDALVRDGAYEIAANVASFQEMREDQVAEYLALFDRAVRPGGEIYLCNSRVFAFRRRFEYPAHWQLRFERTTPFSFLPYKPVEILRRDVVDADHSFANTLVEREYLEDLYHAEHARYEELRRAPANGELKALRQRISQLERSLQRRADHATELKSLRAKARRQKATVERLEAAREQIRVIKRTLARRTERASEVKALREKAEAHDALAAEVAGLRERAEEAAGLRAQIGRLERSLERRADHAAELKSLRAKVRRHEAHAEELADLRGKARRYEAAEERLEAAREQIRVIKRTLARREERASEVKALRERVVQLERGAALHADHAAEAKSLRAKLRRYEKLAEEAATLRSKARAYDRLVAGAEELRSKARRYDRLLPELQELRRKARSYDKIAPRLPELRSKA